MKEGTKEGRNEGRKERRKEKSLDERNKGKKEVIESISQCYED